MTFGRSTINKIIGFFLKAGRQRMYDDFILNATTSRQKSTSLRLLEDYFSRNSTRDGILILILLTLLYQKTNAKK